MKPFSQSSTVAFVIVLTNAVAVLSESGAASKAKNKKGDFDEENYGVKYASKCEVCKIVTQELEFQLNTKFKSVEVIDTGYNYLQDNSKHKKKTAYAKSLIRLQEAVESTCPAMLEYNIHKERKDWTRFARGQSQTFKTLHGLKNKGVKVDLGMPHEMWDKPSAEVTQLKSQCDNFIEKHEDDIEEWYQDESEEPLENFLCKVILPKKEQGCLAVKSKEIAPDSKEKKPPVKSTESKPKPTPKPTEPVGPDATEAGVDSTDSQRSDFEPTSNRDTLDTQELQEPPSERNVPEQASSSSPETTTTTKDNPSAAPKTEL